MNDYELGNCLRGWFFGKFENDEEAWNVLSEKFNNSFPSANGREVVLKKTIKIGLTAGGNETEEQRKFKEKLWGTKRVK